MRSPDALGPDAHLLRPIEETGRGFYIAVGLLLVGVLAGALAYWAQLSRCLGVTGLNQPVSWGFYVTNFVFFIGISHAGTLISAILRMAQAEWRRPITRMAEVITVMVLFIGAGNILLDLGRPDRALNVLLYGRYQSPLLWDATSISAYLTASVFYLYLPLIPDIAILRDHSSKYHFFYTVLALGWTGAERQVRILNRAVAIMAVLVIPVAISVHTVVSFVFSMTLQPGWHSTIFGPYFVVGAIFSGIAALIIFMLIFRRAYRLENYLRHVHFNYLGLLLMTMSFLWFYFTFAEYITAFYGNEPEEMKVFWAKFTGPYAPFFWTMVVCNFVIPMTLLGISRLRTITGILIASISVSIGMWLERFIIIVPTLSHPRLPLEAGSYMPSWVEWGLMLGCFSLFGLFYLLFTKIFPIISIWEIREGREVGLHELEARVRSYLPEEEEGKRRLMAEGVGE